MEQNKKMCPYCGEEIMAAAKKCRYCGEWFDNKLSQNAFSVGSAITAKKTHKNENERISVNKAVFFTVLVVSLIILTFNTCFEILRMLELYGIPWYEVNSGIIILCTLIFWITFLIIVIVNLKRASYFRSCMKAWLALECFLFSAPVSMIGSIIQSTTISWIALILGLVFGTAVLYIIRHKSANRLIQIFEIISVVFIASTVIIFPIFKNS